MASVQLLGCSRVTDCFQFWSGHFCAGLSVPISPSCAQRSLTWSCMLKISYPLWGQFQSMKAWKFWCGAVWKPASPTCLVWGNFTVQILQFWCGAISQCKFYNFGVGQFHSANSTILVWGNSTVQILQFWCGAISKPLPHQLRSLCLNGVKENTSHKLL